MQLSLISVGGAPLDCKPAFRSLSSPRTGVRRHAMQPDSAEEAGPSGPAKKPPSLAVPSPPGGSAPPLESPVRPAARRVGKIVVPGKVSWEARAALAVDEGCTHRLLGLGRAEGLMATLHSLSSATSLLVDICSFTGPGRCTVGPSRCHSRLSLPRSRTGRIRG